jgi:1,2-phenylacetyl-CoA epoxidase catalytic subunit
MESRNTGPDSLQSHDSRYRFTIMQIIRLHAYLERAAAELYGSGLKFIPDSKTLKFVSWHVTEEARHYGMVADLYQEYTGTSLEPWVLKAAETRPLPQLANFLDFVMAQWIFDLTGFWQIADYKNCSWEPYRKVAAQIVKEEVGHRKHGEEMVISLCQSGHDDPRMIQEAQAALERWLKRSLLVFGPLDAPGDEYAVSVGIKSRRAYECVNDYLNDLVSGAERAGLVFPTKDKIGLTLTKNVIWPKFKAA